VRGEHAEVAHESAEGGHVLRRGGGTTGVTGEAGEVTLRHGGQVGPAFGVVGLDGTDDVWAVEEAVGALFRAGHGVAGAASGGGAVVVDDVFGDEVGDGGWHNR
jgi:hypothetical protein